MVPNNRYIDGCIFLARQANQQSLWGGRMGWRRMGWRLREWVGGSEGASREAQPTVKRSPLFGSLAQ